MKHSQQTFLQALSGQEAELSINEPKRMAIYRNNLAGGVLKAMQLTYPVVQQLVGEEFFSATMAEYRKQHLPHSTNLDDYGKEFADFLDKFPPAQSLPYLPDMARLEWLAHISSLADYATPIEIAALAGMAPQQFEQLRFTLHPSAQFFHSQHPVDAIWHMHQAENTGALDISQAPPAYCLIIRPYRRVHIHSLSGEGFAFMQALPTQTLGQAAEVQPEFDFAPTLKQAFEYGLFTQVSTA